MRRIISAAAVAAFLLTGAAEAQVAGPGSSPTGTASPVLVSPLIQPVIAVSTTLDQAQASGGTTLLPLASATGVVVGQTVQGPFIPLGDEVASLVSTAQKTEAANGSFNSAQAVIPMSTTAGFAVGQQCTDTTGTGVIGAGNVIALIAANTSITLTSNMLTNSAGSADSITCDPVATLTTATTQAMPAAAPVQFVTNHAVLSTAAALYDAGDLGVAGNIVSGGVVVTGVKGSTGAPAIGFYDGSNVWTGIYWGSNGRQVHLVATGVDDVFVDGNGRINSTNGAITTSTFYNTNQTPPTVSSGQVWVGMIRGSSGAGFCTLEMVTSSTTQIIEANVAGGGC